MFKPNDNLVKHTNVCSVKVGASEKLHWLTLSDAESHSAHMNEDVFVSSLQIRVKVNPIRMKE